MPDTHPLVSVIIPAYNAEAYLRRSVDSVLSQTLADFEIVLVDDGSTDGTAAICDAYARDDARVRVIHGQNGGVSAARNRGLAAARGDYIAWLDSDDYLLPGALEKLMDALRRNGVRVAMCNYRNILVDGTEQPPRYSLPYDERVYPREKMVGFILSIGMTPVLWGSLMARELYDGIVFPEGKLFEDVRNTYKLHERADGAVMLSQPLLVRVQRPDGITRSTHIANRVDGGRAYIERYEDAVTRWPQYGGAMLISSARTMPLLRRNVLAHPPWKMRAYKDEIRGICRFYRRHADEILPEGADWRLRLEFWLITAGTYAGFALSALFDVIPRRPSTYIKNLRSKDVPKY